MAQSACQCTFLLRKLFRGSRLGRTFLLIILRTLSAYLSYLYSLMHEPTAF
jgi:hypothetical protein